jgi:hypothetical protein
MFMTDQHTRKQRGQAMATTSSKVSTAMNGLATQTPPKTTIEELEDKSLSGKEWRKAYIATLAAMGIIVHAIASVVTVVLYFLLPPSSPVWFAPLFGAISTYIAFLFIALICYPYLGTVKGASTRNYGLLSSRLCQLRARLDALNISEATLTASGAGDYKHVARIEAYRCYERTEWYLRNHRTGLRWVTAMGYLNAWSLLHRAEEALIKVEPPQMTFRGAMHDKLAIQNSTIDKRDELLNKLIQAVTDLYPAGAVYFKEHQPDHDDEILHNIAEAINKMLTTQDQININTRETKSPEQQDAARMTLSEVRRTLNEFRDNLWEGLIRERNHLLNTVGVTGLVTHILLCITIVMSGTKGLPLIMAATAFYMVGAVSGLFGRFYNEVNTNTAIDDFGLSLARLIATPLLSGLAGIGGVIITLVLSDTLTSTASITLESMFKIDLGSLLTAAAFGLAPNLIISGLQQRTAKYATDLQKSKGGGRSSQDS